MLAVQPRATEEPPVAVTFVGGRSDPAVKAPVFVTLSLSRASPKDAPPATPALSPPTAEERSAALARANAPVPQHVRDTRPQGEPWRDHMNSGAYDRWSNRS